LIDIVLEPSDREVAGLNDWQIPAAPEITAVADKRR
jgi:hypothetical protein